MAKSAAEDSEYEEIREGMARILVPRMDLYRRPDGVYEPAWAPVFYNPRMAPNRDIAVVFARTYASLRGVDELVVVEPLAGTGVRSIRYSLEAGAWSVVGDVDPRATALVSLNAKRNNVETRVAIYTADANELLSSLKRRGIVPSIIDIDPFGSPVPFLDAAIQSVRVRGVVAVTATDTAPLSGTHPRALRRRYDATPGRTAWEKEQAVRILAGYIIRRAASHEYGARILLAYYSDYYVRIYAELVRGARRADTSLDQLGYGIYCPQCGYTALGRDKLPLCPACGSLNPTQVGPLYTGPLCETELLQAMIKEAASMADRLASGERVVDFLTRFHEECRITKPYYRLDRLCSILRRSMPKPQLVVEELRRQGYTAVRTLFDPRGVKTDAPHTVVVETVRRLSPG